MTEKNTAARSSTIPTLNRPPTNWHVLDVMKAKARSHDWVALMVDVDPEDLKTCTCDGPALLLGVDPNEYRPGPRIAHQCWVRIAGKHRSRDDAWEALEAMMATRH